MSSRSAERAQMKRACAELVHSVGGIEAAAMVIGKGHSTIHRWQSRNDPDCWINLADLFEIEANAPEPLVTQCLTRLHRAAFVPLARDNWADSMHPARGVLAVTQELGDVSARVGEALSDGDLSAEERSAVLREVHDLERAVAALRLSLEAGYSNP